MNPEGSSRPCSLYRMPCLLAAAPILPDGLLARTIGHKACPLLPTRLSRTRRLSIVFVTVRDPYQQLSKLQSISGGSTLLVVVKIDVDINASLLPGANSSGPFR